MSSRLPAKDGAPGNQKFIGHSGGSHFAPNFIEVRRLFLVIHPGFPQEYLGFIRWCIV
jgi:hypothetical protein